MKLQRVEYPMGYGEYGEGLIIAEGIDHSGKVWVRDTDDGEVYIGWESDTILIEE